jgi:hypothetical protein
MRCREFRNRVVRGALKMGYATALIRHNGTKHPRFVGTISGVPVELPISNTPSDGNAYRQVLRDLRHRKNLALGIPGKGAGTCRARKKHNRPPCVVPRMPRASNVNEPAPTRLDRDPWAPLRALKCQEKAIQ